MDFEPIRDLIEKLTALMDARELDELEVEVEGTKVALRRGRAREAAPVVVSAPVAASAPPPVPQGEATPKAHEAEDLHIVKSPMVGILYRAPAPDADPFVEVGDEVKPDTVVCIIEAMKVMNELRAEVEGVVQAIEVENGRTVEYGQALFAIARAET